MAKVDFVTRFKAARAAFNQIIEGLSETEAGASTPSIKDRAGIVAAWEREVLIADEMIKRDEDSYLTDLDQAEFEQSQTAHRRSWPFEQVRTELDLNYEALLMAWDEYEGEDGPFGPATWLPDQPNSLNWLIERQLEYGRAIATQRGLPFSFPPNLY